MNRVKSQYKIVMLFGRISIPLSLPLLAVAFSLIRLKHIYNFCLFHAHFVLVLHLFAMLLDHLLD